MTTSFRRAVREDMPLLIGITGGTASGKTYSALRVAKGLAGDKKVALIDTENRRAKFYADDFEFYHEGLKAPYTGEAYTEKIREADKAGYAVIIVDSMSHVWNGEGGVLDQQEAELDRRAGDDWAKRDRCLQASWIKPKMRHKQMMTRLGQVRAHLILCFRAEQKIEMVRNAKGKMEAALKRDPIGLHGMDGWMLVCEKEVPSELTILMLLKRDRPGIATFPKVMGQHADFFPADQLIDERCGEKLAAWSAGRQAGSPATQAAEPASFESTCITADQARQITEYAESLDVNSEKFNAWMMEKWSSQKVSELPAHAFGAVIEMLEKKEYERQK